MYFLDVLTREKDVHVPQAKETIKLLLTTTSVRYKSICTFIASSQHMMHAYISVAVAIYCGYVSAKFHRWQTKNLTISMERNQEQAGLAYIWSSSFSYTSGLGSFVLRVWTYLLCVLYHITRFLSLKTPVTLSIHFYIYLRCLQNVCRCSGN